MKNKYNIEQIKEIAKENNLELLSNKYKKLHLPLFWKCNSCNYEFYKNLNQIIYNNQSNVIFEKENNKIKCPKCRGNNILNYFKKLISKHINKETGNYGKLLSEQYTIQRDKYIFQCENNHIWETNLQSIILNHWCPHCVGLAKLIIEEMQQIAIARGGKCLSSNYISSRTDLEWECFNKHIWKSTPNKIKSGHWCPECSSSISEKITRLYFEKLFNNKFPRSYPNWLKNSRNNQMELDGYCEQLGIAFEHNGEQHYKKIEKFAMSDNDLSQRIEDDNTKQQFCKNHNIKLIIIPQLFDKLKLENLREYIKEQCIKQDIVLPIDFDTIDVDYNEAYVNNDSNEYLVKLREIAAKQGGYILTDNYVNSYSPIICQCKKGHKFESYSSNIKSGYWCPEAGCNPTRKMELINIIDYANKFGLMCLSQEYIHQNCDMEFECKKSGHKFMRSFKQLKRFPYCSACKKENGEIKRWTIEDMKKLAIERNGECLSEQYINNHKKLTWKCNICKNVWEAIPSNILDGGWCPNYRKH